MAIHSVILKTKIRIQDVISPYSFDQFLISSTPRMWKRVKKRMNQLTVELWCLDSSINLKNPRVFLRREEQLYLEDNWAYPSDLTIHRDQRSK